MRSQKVKGYSIGEKDQSFFEQMANFNITNPGVGSYDLDLNNSVMTIASHNKSQMQGSTIPKDKRFKSSSDLPGVGQYQIQNNILMKNGFMNKQFGIAQRAPEKLFVSQSTGNIGPGQYNPKNLQQKDGTKFTQSKTRNQYINEREESSKPGVGSYYVKSQNKIPNIAFSLQPKKFALVTDNSLQVPGVGMYDITSTKLFLPKDINSSQKYNKSFSNTVSQQLKTSSPKIQNSRVNSQEDIYVYKKNKSQNDQSPGPQKYDHMKRFTFYSQNSIINSYKASSKCKTLTNVKFSTQVRKNIFPPPDSYCQQVSFQKVQEWKSKTGASMGTGQRSNLVDKNIINNPGVGHYESNQVLRSNRSTDNLDSITSGLCKLLSLPKIQSSISKKDKENKLQQIRLKYLQQLGHSLSSKEIQELMKNKITFRELQQMAMPSPFQYLPQQIQSEKGKNGKFQISNRKHEFLDIFNIKYEAQRSPGPSVYNKHQEIKQDKGVGFTQTKKPENVFGGNNNPDAQQYNSFKSKFDTIVEEGQANQKRFKFQRKISRNMDTNLLDPFYN